MRMNDWQVKSFVHSGITVKNLEASIQFYTELLGFKLVRRQTNDVPYIYDIVEIPGLEKIELAFLEMPDGTVIELLEYVGVRTYSGEARSCDYGTGHICLQVKNLDSMFHDLQAKGVQFISEEVVTITAGNHVGSKAVYMKDPDGYLIELMDVQ
ncbi:MAG TPA: VOC family protein [Pseudogracilibacillus sp.]|nr:VOC family protein [Pseudogracilibacillus sp.]